MLKGRWAQNTLLYSCRLCFFISLSVQDNNAYLTNEGMHESMWLCALARRESLSQPMNLTQVTKAASVVLLFWLIILSL